MAISKKLTLIVDAAKSEFYKLTYTVNVANKLFTEVFGEDYVTIQAYGNVFTSIAFLHGLVVEELREEELDYHDPDYEMLTTVRAVKQERLPHNTCLRAFRKSNFANYQ